VVLLRTTREILQAVKSGKMSVQEAEVELRTLSLTEVGQIGMLDMVREERTGIPEVVFAEPKGTESLISIASKILERKEYVLLTRVSQEKLVALKGSLDGLRFDVSGEGDHLTVLISTKQWSAPETQGSIAIITAGTSDIVYAMESIALAKVMGVHVLSFFDIGVAGIHRLVEPIKRVLEEDVDAIVVFAGLEGALPTVVASLVDVPVIGVPVPIGYGHGGAGETALSSMLQSCAPGLAVVNIGNGLGAGAIACLIARRRASRNDNK
jgi:NCAIR mutase (PurE)-related protein